MKQYFSFGQAHTHNINGVVFDKDCLLEIETDTADGAREIMHFIFGPHWAFQYDEYESIIHHFPRGIINVPRLRSKMRNTCRATR